MNLKGPHPPNPEIHFLQLGPTSQRLHKFPQTVPAAGKQMFKHMGRLFKRDIFHLNHNISILAHDHLIIQMRLVQVSIPMGLKISTRKPFLSSSQAWGNGKIQTILTEPFQWLNRDSKHLNLMVVSPSFESDIFRHI